MTHKGLVLVVDDDEAVRDSLKALLKSHGYQVQCYANARGLLREVDGVADGCLLLDIRMPGMTGLELQQELIARRVHMPVVMITGHADVPMAVDAMKAGAVDFIEKPYAGCAILDTVERALAMGWDAAWPQIPPEEVRERVVALTPREHDVLLQLLLGRRNKTIAHLLGISVRTAEVHRARVMNKMGAVNLAHLIRLAALAGVQPSR